MANALASLATSLLNKTGLKRHAPGVAGRHPRNAVLAGARNDGRPGTRAQDWRPDRESGIVAAVRNRGRGWGFAAIALIVLGGLAVLVAFGSGAGADPSPSK